MEVTIEYSITGKVVGTLYDNSQGVAAAKTFAGNNKHDVIAQAEKAFEDGSLANTRALSHVTGARLVLHVLKTLTYDGDKYTHNSSGRLELGKITEEDEDNLMSIENWAF